MLKHKHTTAMGFRETQIGTAYLRAAVNHVAAFPDEMRPAVTKDVYPYVAVMFETTINAVERGIRYAIHQSTLSGTNREVIPDLAMRVKDGEFNE